MDISNITNSSVYASSSVLENGESETFINESTSTLNNSYSSISIENQNVQSSISSSSPTVTTQSENGSQQSVSSYLDSSYGSSLITENNLEGSSLNELVTWYQENREFSSESGELWRTCQQTADNGGGDCEDLANEFASILTALGYNVQVGLQGLESGEGHAMILISDASGVLHELDISALVEMNTSASSLTVESLPTADLNEYNVIYDSDGIISADNSYDLQTGGITTGSWRDFGRVVSGGTSDYVGSDRKPTTWRNVASVTSGGASDYVGPDRRPATWSEAGRMATYAGTGRAVEGSTISSETTTSTTSTESSSITGLRTTLITSSSTSSGSGGASGTSASSSSTSSSSSLPAGWSFLADGRQTFGEADGGRWTESDLGSGKMVYTSSDGWTYDENTQSWSKLDPQDNQFTLVMSDSGLTRISTASLNGTSSSSSSGWSFLADGRKTYLEADGGRWTESGIGTDTMIYTSPDGWTYSESTGYWSKPSQQNDNVTYIRNNSGLFSYDNDSDAWSFFNSDSRQWEGLSSDAINGN